MEKRPGIEGALDAALDALLAGDQQSLLKAMRIIERHPRAQELRRLLTSAIETREAVRTAPSDQARVRHLRMIGVACREHDRARSVRKAIDINRMRRLALRPLAVAGASFGLLLPGTLALASTAQPGDPLYGTKLKVEQVQLALTTGAEAEIALHLKFAERRMDEIELLEQDGNVGQPFNAAASNLESHSAAVKEVVAAMSQQGHPPAQLTVALERHRDGLTELAGRAGCEHSRSAAGCDGLETALASSVSALQRLKDDGSSSGGPSGPLATGEPDPSPTAPAAGKTRTGKDKAPVKTPESKPAVPTTPPESAAPSETPSPPESPSPEPSPSPSPDPSASPTPDPSASPSSDPSQDPSPAPPPTDPTPGGSTQTPAPQTDPPATESSSGAGTIEPHAVDEGPTAPLH